MTFRKGLNFDCIIKASFLKTTSGQKQFWIILTISQVFFTYYLADSHDYPRRWKKKKKIDMFVLQTSRWSLKADG
jgi:hypothetical protein